MQRVPRKLPVHVASAPEVLGRCPECGGEVLEGEKYYYCYESHRSRSCRFRVGKDYFKRWGKGKLTAATMARLLNGEMITIKELISPTTGRVFDCQGVLVWFAQYGYWGVKFIFSPEDLNEVRRSRGR